MSRSGFDVKPGNMAGSTPSPTGTDPAVSLAQAGFKSRALADTTPSPEHWQPVMGWSGAPQTSGIPMMQSLQAPILIPNPSTLPLHTNLTREPMLQFTTAPAWHAYPTAVSTVPNMTLPFGQPAVPAFQFTGAPAARPIPAVRSHARGADRGRKSKGKSKAKEKPSLASPTESSPTSSIGHKTHLPSPDPPSPPKRPSIKRQRPEDDEDEASSAQLPQHRLAHNVIEKRYRTNLNDKISALRDSIPALRAMCRSSSDEGDCGAEDLEGLAPAQKINKGVVMAKATEYIKHLEKQNNRMEQEILELRTRVANMETMLSSRYAVPSSMATHPLPFYAPEIYSQTPMSQSQPAGMNLPPYGPQSFPAYPGQQLEPDARRPTVVGRSNVMGRAMLAGVTTLMIVEGVSRRRQRDNDGQALFALPLEGLMPSTNPASTPDMLFSVVRFITIIASLIYIFLPLFSYRPKHHKKADPVKLMSAYSLASPVELRQKAWLTAVQTVWVPGNGIWLEIAALCLKMLKLSTRKLVGWNGYSRITGLTREHENARVRAWEVAIDAQLTGGDAEISNGRLLLTYLASNTLPDTPARLMLKALHARMLFWGSPGARSARHHLLNLVTAERARGHWNAARRMHRISGLDGSTKRSDDGLLPHHLAALLELDAGDVLVDAVVQRAVNLAWNRASSSGAEGDDDGAMDAVVADVHIAAPLDALAAWWSTLVLGRVLLHAIGRQLGPAGRAAEGGAGDDLREDLRGDLRLALRAAPPPSSARVRALVAQAVLVDRHRALNIAQAAAALPRLAPAAEDPPSDCSAPGPSAGPPGAPPPPPPGRPSAFFVRDAPVPGDVRAALALARCVALASPPAGPRPPPSPARARGARLRLRHAAALAGGAAARAAGPGALSLLSLAAALLLLRRFGARGALRRRAAAAVERLAVAVRVWVGGGGGGADACAAAAARVPGFVREAAVRCCVGLGRRAAGAADEEDGADENDSGYGSGDGRRPRGGKAPAGESAAAGTVGAL
jgi:hypothetical protein